VDFQTVVNLAVGVVMPVVGWVLKRQADRDRDFQDFRIEVAKEYVTHQRLERMFTDVKDSLSRIEEKLDKKADK
jgi:hypothetical protein